ncbi:hypothetical protein LINGRAHAP2_LOCUS2206, partial [Linum grandiflorum]
FILSRSNFFFFDRTATLIAFAIAICFLNPALLMIAFSSSALRSLPPTTLFGEPCTRSAISDRADRDLKPPADFRHLYVVEKDVDALASREVEFVPVVEGDEELRRRLVVGSASSIATVDVGSPGAVEIQRVRYGSRNLWKLIVPYGPLSTADQSSIR